MSDLVELHGHPTLSSPVMILALEGWIDAGMAAAGAMTAILDGIDTEPLATFDTDVLLDHRARRPMMSLVEGHVEELTWPSIEVRGGMDDVGNHVVLVVGAEPDHGWRRFCTAVTDLALDLDVRMVIGLGAYPAPVPHTRDTNLALTSPSPDVLDAHTGFFKGTIDVPAGIQSAIEVSTHTAGIPSMALWAQVPHYISGMGYPAGSLALVEGLGRVAGLSFPTATLAIEASETRHRLDELVSGNHQHEEMLRQLEEVVDSSPPPDDLGPLPTGDQLADEFEKFLRDQES
ncbi:MAG TPA: PAC2 family protein [Microthrixaceae bacterium]|nr:PAC2 family protein [Microthrixaceae bacterium]HNI34368.1 PAC2 family protein [Microthrixaceae bacterium]